MKSNWTIEHLDTKNQIVYIVDLNGPTSVTNDVESVLQHVKINYGTRYRLVYKDSDGEWWEAKRIAGTHPSEWRVTFERWHGIEWDILRRPYERTN